MAKNKENILRAHIQGLRDDMAVMQNRIEVYEADIYRLKSIIRDAHTTMKHAQLFISTREKMHEAGQELYQDVLDSMGTI